MKLALYGMAYNKHQPKYETFLNYSKNCPIIFSLSFELLSSVDRAKVTSTRKQIKIGPASQRRPFLDHHSVLILTEKFCSFVTSSTLSVFLSSLLNTFNSMFFLQVFTICYCQPMVVGVKLILTWIPQCGVQWRITLYSVQTAQLWHSTAVEQLNNVPAQLWHSMAMRRP